MCSSVMLGAITAPAEAYLQHQLHHLGWQVIALPQNAHQIGNATCLPVREQRFRGMGWMLARD